VDFVLTIFLTLVRFDCTLEFRLFCFSHNTTLMVSEQLSWISVRAIRFFIRLMIIVKNQEKFAGCSGDLRVRVLTTLPDSIHCLIIVPYVALVHFNHYVQRAAG